MQVGFHISPGGPVYFEFDEVTCPVFVRLGWDRYARFEAVIADEDARDEFATIVGREFAALLEKHRDVASRVREAREAAALVWYLGSIERVAVIRNAIEEAEVLLGVSPRVGAVAMIETYTEMEARTLLEASNVAAEAWTYGLGVQRLSI